MVWLKCGHAFAYFVVSVYKPDGIIIQFKFYFDRKTRLYLIVPASKIKCIFAQESFYLQGILDDIDEQDTSFPDCKHKHMMKSGAPPGKFGVLYRRVTYRIYSMVSQVELILRVITLWFLVLSQFF